jgi:hypothetical protein
MRMDSDPYNIKGAIVVRLPKAGYFFAATQEQVAALDLVAGPKSPINMPGSKSARPLVSEGTFPYTYDPSFLSVMARCVLPNRAYGTDSLEPVQVAHEVTLYRFPKHVTDALAELTPDRPEHTRSVIRTIADRLMEHSEPNRKMTPNRVYDAVLFVRGYALKASPRTSGKELYYWFRQLS